MENIYIHPLKEKNFIGIDKYFSSTKNLCTNKCHQSKLTLVKKMKQQQSSADDLQ
jgi:hypothetical protein